MRFGANCRQSAYNRSTDQSLQFPLEDCSVLRIAVLGCGRIGRMHAANVAAHPRAKLVSVYDTHRPFAEDVAARNGITAADSADAIFAAADIDAVLVATATDTHADYIERAVAAGKPVLCEKPIDLSLARVNACAEKIGDTKFLSNSGSIGVTIRATVRHVPRCWPVILAICTKSSSHPAIPQPRPAPIWKLQVVWFVI